MSRAPRTAPARGRTAPDEAAAAASRAAILDMAETLLARHGAGKTGVVDVARALHMSHANVYRFFPSKAALFDAVAERWLERDSAPLDKVAAGRAAAPKRLKQWLITIYRRKRRKVVEEPELFAFIKALAAEASGDFFGRHQADLARQLGRILDDGVATGDFRIGDRDRTVRAILDATMPLRHPAFVADRNAMDEKRAAAIADMIVASLRAGTV